MPKRTPISVRPIKHAKYKFQVTVPPELNGGSRTRKFFVARKEALAYAADIQVQKENFGTRLLQIPEPFRQEALACAERLRPFQASLIEAVTFFLQYRQNAQKSCTVAELVAKLLVTGLKKHWGTGSEFYCDDLDISQTLSVKGEHNYAYDGRSDRILGGSAAACSGRKSNLDQRTTKSRAA